jgi:hypothetical protein
MYDNDQLTLPDDLQSPFDGAESIVKREVDYLQNFASQPKVDDPLPVESHATIKWDVPRNEAAGKYRIVYHGDYLVGNTTTPFSGMSREFTIYRHV